MVQAPRRILIVTAGRARGSLSAARELGRAGWTIGVGTPDGSGMVAASRWVDHRHRVVRPRGECNDFVDDVNRAIAAHDYDLVVAGSDDTLGALVMHRDRIAAPVGHPDAWSVDSALDKLDLAERAMHCDIAAPLTRPATDDVLAAWNGPLVVKCRSHWHPDQRNVYRVEARQYPDADAAADRIEAIRAAGFEPIVQAPVDGRLSALSGICVEGRLIGRVHQEAERVWPTPSGVSSRAVTVVVDEDLAQRCERLLQSLDWRGIVEMQFLTDDDGRRHLIDVNGRFYGSMALAIAAGVPLPTAHAGVMLGESIDALADAAPGVRFSWIAGDARRALAERRGGLVKDLASSLAWARGASTCVWDRGDLGPIRRLALDRIRRVRSDDGATT